jgi:chromosome segregation ATPase
MTPDAKQRIRNAPAVTLSQTAGKGAVTAVATQAAIAELQKQIAEVEQSGIRLTATVTLTEREMEHKSPLQIQEMQLRRKYKKLMEKKSVVAGITARREALEHKTLTAQKQIDDLTKRVAEANAEIEKLRKEETGQNFAA